MADTPDKARARADAKLRAWAEHIAATQATRDKTARLRAGRLAREAVEQETGATKRPAAARKRPAR